MKKIFFVIFFSIMLSNLSFSKTLDVGFYKLEVPNKFYLINWSNSSMNGQINICTEEFDNCFGIVDKKLKEVINRLENGESYENIEILKPLISLLNKQDSNCEELDNGMCKGTVQRFWSKLKSTLKKNNSGTIFNYMEANDIDTYLDTLNLEITIDELREMSNIELIDLTKEVRDQFTFGNKNYWAISDDLGIKVKNFKISKNSNGSIYSILQGDVSYNLTGLQFNAKVSFYASEFNEKLFTFDGICLVNCPKFYNTFNQIVNNSFKNKTTTTTSTNTTSSTSTENDFIQQLKQLNELYKSGILTKEEFEKAKKKLLN